MTLGLFDPAFLAVAAGVLWTPASITTALWLDAADASTITLNGTNVSQWTDKSGNSKNATQSTVANQPARTLNGLNGKSVVQFDGSNDFMTLASPYGIANQSGLSFFSVAKSANSSAVIIGTADLTLMRLRPGNQMRPFDGSTAAGNSTSYQIDDSDPHVISFIQSGSLLSTWRDGSPVQGITGTRAAFNYSGTQWLARGDGGLGTTITQIDLSEIVVVGSALSVADRQRIEGYLAHKWGLTGNLPIDHPYKTSAPTT